MKNRKSQAGNLKDGPLTNYTSGPADDSARFCRVEAEVVDRCRGIDVLLPDLAKTWMAGTRPGHDEWKAPVQA
jgi:hypothetical protein